MSIVFRDLRPAESVMTRAIEPCFECPPDECALESTDFAETLAELKEAGIALIESTVTDGCIENPPLTTVSITCNDKIVCSRCCRGELVVDRTWTVTNTACEQSSPM